MTAFASICLLLLLSCLGDLVHGRTVLLSSCSVNAHTHEMREHYSSLRDSAVSSILTRWALRKKTCRLTCELNSLRPQVSGDTEIGVKLLDKSWITSVQVRFGALLRFGTVCSVDPCLTFCVCVRLRRAERPEVLPDASGAAFLHREGLRQLPVPSVAGAPMLQRPGQRLHHHQTKHSQMCKCILAVCRPTRARVSLSR